MKNVNGQEMPTNIYYENETMRLLGKQKIVYCFWYNEEVREQVRQVADARKFSFTPEAAADLFTLGYIHGKRAERARRKK